MQARFPEIVIGRPIVRAAVSVFPLFCPPRSKITYRLAAEALADGAVEIKEIGAGRVGTIRATNKSPSPVLFLEGEHLVGAKQNRIVNASALVGGGKEADLPVSCVEEKRWAARSGSFHTGGAAAPARIRQVLKGSVNAAYRSSGQHTSDQRGIWEEVKNFENALGRHSPTCAMGDLFSAYADRISGAVGELQHVRGSTGLAVAIGRKLVSIDLFDKDTTCGAFWRRLLAGVMLDAMRDPGSKASAGIQDVDEALETLRAADWLDGAVVGEGKELRATHAGLEASLLLFEDNVIHLGAVAA